MVTSYIKPTLLIIYCLFPEQPAYCSRKVTGKVKAGLTNPRFQTSQLTKIVLTNPVKMYLDIYFSTWLSEYPLSRKAKFLPLKVLEVAVAAVPPLRV